MHACMRACMAYYTIEKPAKAVTCMEAEAVSAAVDRPKLCRKFQVYNSNLNSRTCVTANVCRAMHASYSTMHTQVQEEPPLRLAPLEQARAGPSWHRSGH